MQGLVATSEIHAARAGADALRDGGTAVDAAVCAAACLTVTEPTSNGLGGDLFALVAEGATVRALSSSGAAPAALSLADVDAAGMPASGWLPVTVPGQVAGWGTLAGLGRLGLPRLLAPAIALARDGFTVGPVTAAAWARAARRLGGGAEWRASFLPGGHPPAAGERFVHAALARSLAVLARDGAQAFYTGELAERLVAHARATGGWLAASDLAAHRPSWEAPLRVALGDHEVLGLGAPTQGVAALLALAVVDGLPAAGVHERIEAFKLALADAYATVGDPQTTAAATAALLAPEHVARRRAAISSRAGASPAGAQPRGGTVLVCAGDAEGRLCCLIQSNFHGFGSGVVVPETGIALNNRGFGFSLDPAHPNALAGGKRPFHTLMPGMLLRDGVAVAAFGCMGGQMQAQGHVQLVTRLLAGEHPQAAVDAPRWRHLDDGPLALEVGFDGALAAELAARGHAVRPELPAREVGGAQIVLLRDGALLGGSDRRKDGGVVST
jgi:gamma-glutamyltranspeptidase/glutathione hydrolase